MAKQRVAEAGQMAKEQAARETLKACVHRLACIVDGVLPRWGECADRIELLRVVVEADCRGISSVLTPVYCAVRDLGKDDEFDDCGSLACIKDVLELLLGVVDRMDFPDNASQEEIFGVAEILRDVRKDVVEFLADKTAESSLELEADTSNSNERHQLEAHEPLADIFRQRAALEVAAVAEILDEIAGKIDCLARVDMTGKSGDTEQYAGGLALLLLHVGNEVRGASCSLREVDQNLGSYPSVPRGVVEVGHE